MKSPTTTTTTTETPLPPLKNTKFKLVNKSLVPDSKESCEPPTEIDDVRQESLGFSIVYLHLPLHIAILIGHLQAIMPNCIEELLLKKLEIPESKELVPEKVIRALVEQISYQDEFNQFAEDDLEYKRELLLDVIPEFVTGRTVFREKIAALIADFEKISTDEEKFRALKIGARFLPLKDPLGMYCEATAHSYSHLLEAKKDIRYQKASLPKVLNDRKSYTSLQKLTLGARRDLQNRAELFQAAGQELDGEIGLLATDISKQIFEHLHALSELKKLDQKLKINESELEKLQEAFLDFASSAIRTPPPLS